MYKRMISAVNEDLKKTKKAIVAIGCSFVQGQGAINDELYESYEWNFIKQGEPIEIILTRKEKKQILKKYPSVFEEYDKLNFTFMEYDNAFVNVLCKKYLNKTYTPINFGLRGCGNRGSIKELYFNNIQWDLAEEIIVVYMPSGLERFDFINDTNVEHFRWICMWPHFENAEKNSNKRLLWEGYNKSLYSEKFEVLEQIAHVQELLTWVNYKNAKLIITPGFDRRYDRNYFKLVLEKTIHRDVDKNIKKSFNIFEKTSLDIDFLDLFPWDNFFKPQGHSTFADLAIAQEPSIKDKLDYYGQFLGNRSPNGWMTSCAHPGQKSHDLFAKLLSIYIKGIQ